MSQTISLLCVLLFIVVFRRPIEKAPLLFYVLAGIVAALGIYLTFTPSPGSALRAVVFAIQKGHVGFAFLATVMFIGTFDERSTLRQAIGPIRAELSIIGGILMVAHFVPYLASYVRMLGSLTSLRPSVLASLGIAIIILALLVILVVTSFKFIKRSLSAKTWKNIQLFAYPFFILIYFHLLGYLIVPASSGNADAVAALVFYTLVFGAYIVLRLLKHAADKQNIATQE